MLGDCRYYACLQLMSKKSSHVAGMQQGGDMVARVQFHVRSCGWQTLLRSTTGMLNLSGMCFLSAESLRKRGKDVIYPQLHKLLDCHIVIHK
ncbi:hypothetical protein M758_8G144300 [Ceratodon purpureus]|nr:hypothetical protein M758_8G144300 [Ceratodon purpureus]